MSFHLGLYTKLKYMKRLINWIPTLVIVLIGFTPLVWFYKRPGILIDGSDTNFPLDPVSWFTRRLYVWNSTLNGGVDFSSSSAGLFFHFTQVVPTFLGFNLQYVQIISLVFWFLLIVILSYLFAYKIFPNKFMPRLVFVAFYCFNIYLFNTWENVKVANLALTASIPFGLLILFSLKEKSISFLKAAFLSSVLGIIAMGSGINPAYFITLFLVFFIFYMSCVLTARNFSEVILRTKEFLFVSSIVVLINFHWILPTLNYIFSNIGPFGSIDKIGYTNWIDSLSRDTSLVNIFRLQGAWDWYSFDSATNLPLYIPYAVNYFFRTPFIFFSFFITSLAFLAFIFRNSKEKSSLHVFFGVLLLVGVFLGAGTHLPTGGIFRQVLLKLPFFSLFRSPWYIFTPFVTLAYAGLISLLTYQAYTIGSSIRPRFLSWVVGIGAVSLVIANLIYTYPLVTGKIFRPKLSDNFYIRFPSYVFDAQKWLRQAKTFESGRIISFPDDEIERFKWGYNGIDSILGLISPAEVLFNPLNAPEAPVSQLLREFYDSIKKGEIESAKNIAAILNTAWLFEKKDQSTLSSGLPFKFANEVQQFGEWNFYEFPNKEQQISRIRSVANIFVAYPYSQAAKIATTLPVDSILVNPNDSVMVNLPKTSDIYGKIVYSKNSQAETFTRLRNSEYLLSDHLIERDISFVEYSFTIPERGSYGLMLERYGLEGFGINLNTPLEIELNGNRMSVVIAKITDSYVYLSPVSLEEGVHVIQLSLSNPNLVEGGNFDDKRTIAQRGKSQLSVITENDNRFLSIFNKSDKDASASFNVNSFDPISNYYIEVKYKQIYGTMASILASQNSTKSPLKSQIQGMPNYPEWGTFSFYYEPVRAESSLKIDLVAGHIGDALGTKIYYDDLVVRRLFLNNLILIKNNKTVLSTPEVKYTKVNPAEYDLEVKGADGSHIILFAENYSNDWAIEIEGANQSVVLNPLHFSGNLYSNAWYINSSPLNYKAKIHYRPQRLKLLGYVVSGSTFVLTTVLFLLNLLRKKD